MVVEDRGATRVVWLNRPSVRNAIDLELRELLAERLEQAMSEDAVRAIVLTGAGISFCSGGDISSMRRQDADATRVRARAACRVIRAIWDGTKPVIAAVEGNAFGAGTALAIACDRVVAAADAVFATTFTGVGLAGDMGVFASLPARIGTSAAKQLLMLPRRIHGAEALSMGLVDSLAEPSGALQTALAEAERLAAGPPLALAEIKALLGAGSLPPHDVLDREVEIAARLFDTADFAEGVAAFHERREPDFRGV